MATPIVIKSNDSGVTVKVTKFGQLVVAPLQYSTPVSDSLDVINTAFNFITPEQGQSIVITDVIASADNNVSNVVPANVEIYSATSADTTTEETILLSPEIVRADNFIVTGLNLLVPEGLWVNAKTDDNNVLVTIMFYRVPAEDI